MFLNSARTMTLVRHIILILILSNGLSIKAQDRMNCSDIVFSYNPFDSSIKYESPDNLPIQFVKYVGEKDRYDAVFRIRDNPKNTNVEITINLSNGSVLKKKERLYLDGEARLNEYRCTTKITESELLILLEQQIIGVTIGSTSIIVNDSANYQTYLKCLFRNAHTDLVLSKEFFTIVEEMPEFSGGNELLLEIIKQKTLVYTGLSGITFIFWGVILLKRKAFRV